MYFIGVAVDCKRPQIKLLNLLANLLRLVVASMSKNNSLQFILLDKTEFLTKLKILHVFSSVYFLPLDIITTQFLMFYTQIKLHNPAEIPQIGESYFRVPLDSEIVLSVKANMMTTSSSLYNYSPNKRQCFFPNERYLQYFKIYTQINCQLECLTNFTLNQCKCSKFNMPRKFLQFSNKSLHTY